jgi:hypothetical protein
VGVGCTCGVSVTVGAGRRFERGGLKVEVYGDGRYLTVTGNALVDAPLARA